MCVCVCVCGMALGEGLLVYVTSFSVFSAGVTGTQDARPNDGDRLVLGPSTHCGAGRLLSRPIKGKVYFGDRSKSNIFLVHKHKH